MNPLFRCNSAQFIHCLLYTSLQFLTDSLQHVEKLSWHQYLIADAIYIQHQTVFRDILDVYKRQHVINAVRTVDPRAFINSIKTTELSGKFYHKPED